MPVVANGKTKTCKCILGNRCRRSTGEDHGNSCRKRKNRLSSYHTAERKTFRHQHLQKYRRCSDHGKRISAATVFSPAVQMRTSNKGRKEKRTVGKKLTPTIKVTATSIKLKVKQSTSKIKVSRLAKGDSVKSWTSSNKKIVSVNSKGTMKGLKAGKAKVTITLASGKKQVISITVQKTTVRTTKITGLKSSVTVARNKKLTLKPVISPITSQEKVTYSSSNKKIATVNSKGCDHRKEKGNSLYHSEIWKDPKKSKSSS